jgi:hypothetical protein
MFLGILYRARTRKRKTKKCMRTMKTAFFWVITQREVVNSYRRFETIFGPILTLEDGTVNCPETSVRNYHYTLRNNLEERSSYLHRGGSLKSHKITVFV